MSLLSRIEQESRPRAREPSPAHDRQGQGTNGPVHDGYRNLKARIQDKLIAELDPSRGQVHSDDVKAAIERMYDDILLEERIVLSRTERERLFEQIVAEILGLGPLEPYMADPTITEVMVNGANAVYVERNGKIIKTDTAFESEEHLMRIIERIVAPLGRRIDESSPMVDARLPDGSRVNAVIPPICLVGPTLTIRKFSEDPLTVDQLISFGTVSAESMTLLEAGVQAKLNILISGGTGSGKTTFLNVLSGYIPRDERIVTIEDAAELQLRQEHVLTLESRPPNVEGKGVVTIRNLVINSLRMRPDRIIVGECRGPEAFDMLQAMNTGHEGSMTTIHANNSRDALGRLENMVLMAGTELPHRAIREQIAAALDVIIQLERLRDGSRKVVGISEIQGMEGDVVTMSEIFKFEKVGYENGRVIGKLRPTGLRPRFMEKIEAEDIRIPASTFGAQSRRRF